MLMNHDPVPPGSAPRSAVPPLWLHTIELDRDQRLDGVVVVVRQEYLEAVARLLSCDLGRMRDLVVHAAGEERWLRLDSDDAIRLRHSLGKLHGGEPEYIPGAHKALVHIDHIINEEDY